MALIKCPQCGAQISEYAKKCPKCGLENPNDARPNLDTAKTVEVAETPTPTQLPITKKKSGRGWLVATLVAVLLICVAAGVGGYFYYENVYLPEKIDREAPRTYPIVNLQLRSSKMAGGDFNKITTVPYGGELITYQQEGEWAKVKYVQPDGKTSYEGYVASSYLLNKHDFYIINSLLGDNDVREVLSTAKVRKALLDYFKNKGYVGKLSDELQTEIGVSVPTEKQWQVLFHHGQSKPNEVLFKRIVDSSSKYTDMIVLIENVKDQNRKALIFHFDDDETPHLLDEQDGYDLKEGNIKDVAKSEEGFFIIMG